MNTLKIAINNTFAKRHSLDYLKNYQKIIKSLINNELLKKRWATYSNKYSYAKDININEILIVLKDLIKELYDFEAIANV